MHCFLLSGQASVGCPVAFLKKVSFQKVKKRSVFFRGVFSDSGGVFAILISYSTILYINQRLVVKRFLTVGYIIFLWISG